MSQDPLRVTNLNEGRKMTDEINIDDIKKDANQSLASFYDEIDAAFPEDMLAKILSCAKSTDASHYDIPKLRKIHQEKSSVLASFQRQLDDLGSSVDPDNDNDVILYGACELLLDDIDIELRILEAYAQGDKELVHRLIVKSYGEEVISDKKWQPFLKC